MAEICGHLDQIEPVTPSSTVGCSQCIAMGARWMHLRLCLTCGEVGCCDSSPEQARQQARRRARPSDRALLRARRGMELVLRGRGRVRRRRPTDRRAHDSTSDYELLRRSSLSARPAQQPARQLPRRRARQHVLRRGVHVAEAPLERARLVDRGSAAQVVGGVHDRGRRRVACVAASRSAARLRDRYRRRSARLAQAAPIRVIEERARRAPRRPRPGRSRVCVAGRSASRRAAQRRRLAAGELEQVVDRRARDAERRLPRSPAPAARTAGTRTAGRAPERLRSSARSARSRAREVRRTCMSWLPVPRRPDTCQVSITSTSRGREQRQPDVRAAPRRASCGAPSSITMQPPISQSQWSMPLANAQRPVTR